ncbi:MAG TPA: type II toxin-antitoxin system RelE/ParE family toxin [Rhizomicrobium sp.]|nr:type II toxin-antitoxin system RelE/ParE family toxin [Rhizomicrobium sp.]
MRLDIAHRARLDLRNIARYSREQWGAANKARYMAAIRLRMPGLLRQPGAGVARDDLAAGLRCVPVGRHVIYYRIAEGRIAVIRVLHQRMDAKRHF